MHINNSKVNKCNDVNTMKERLFNVKEKLLFNFDNNIIWLFFIKIS